MGFTGVELRVHGVSGTPPEQMLADDHVVQVAGDELGRVFRRARERTADRDPTGSGSRHDVEAYHWGAMTSGSRQQGLWLLLAPFGLVNAAQFMLVRPRTAPARAAHAVVGAALRLVGLALTLLFVLTAAVIAVDLWAWQRAGLDNGLAYAVAFAAPLALLGLYARLARPKPDPDLNLAVRPVQPPPTDGAEPGEHVSELVRPTFFEADPDAPSLKRLHLAAGMLLVAVLAVCPATLGTGGVATAVFWSALGLLGAVTVGAVALGDPSSQRSWAAPVARSGVVRRACRLAYWLAIAAVAAGLVTIIVSPPEPGTAFPGIGPMLHYPGIDWASYAVLGLALLGLGVMAVASIVMAVSEWRRPKDGVPRHFRPYLAGTGPFCVASIATFLGVGYAGAFSTAAATAFRSVRPDAPGTGVDVLVPELLSRVVYAWGLTVLAVALILVPIVVVRRRRRIDGLSGQVTVDVSGLVPKRWERRITNARWTGRLKNGIGPIALFFTALGLLLSVAVVVEIGPIVRVPPTSWPRLGLLPSNLAGHLSASEWWPRGTAPFRSAMLTVGTLALSGLAAGLVSLGRSALLGGAARRGVNVLWDVVSFWPRAVHPFVPATYAQRAVADIEDRVLTHRGIAPPAGRRREDVSAAPQEPGSPRNVVLCAHSQGSLLVFAALLRLLHCADAPVRSAVTSGVGLLTFGSQLQVMFSRGFPAYVSHRAVTELHRRLGGAWVNLYRDTDPLAGPVLSWDHRGDSVDPVRVATSGQVGLAEGPHPATGTIPTIGRQQFGPDWRLADPPMERRWPPPAGPDLRHHALLPLRGHSDYWLDQAWPDALEAVENALVRPVDGPDGSPAPAGAERVTR